MSRLNLNLTPKALANFSPGFERSDNPGDSNLSRGNPEKGSLTAEPFQGFMAFLILTQGSRFARTLG